MSDVFISYAREDAATARMMADAIQAAGFSVWWDRHIPPGKTWDDVIGHELEAASCVLVLWSKTSVQSRWVREEAERAVSRGCLIPVLVDKVDPPFGFGRIEAADLTRWRGEPRDSAFADMLRAVSDLVQVTPDRPAADQRASGRAQPAPQPASRGGKYLWIAGGVAVVVALFIAAYFLRTPQPEREMNAVVPLKVPEPPKAGESRTNPDDGQTYVWIPPGEFQMGCSVGDTDCDAQERPLHAVRISRGFWLGQTEVTQAAYEKVMGENPSGNRGMQHPVENVSWDRARKYCELVAGRLPTEAEWEYAARAGTSSARYGELDAIAWYRDNSNLKTHPVKKKDPNSWGLYDMLGNVWEWVGDKFDAAYYQPSLVIDPKGPTTEGVARTVRGGSSAVEPGRIRASYRYGYGGPGAAHVEIGFRCAREVIP